jgi:excisionase family DNA binding protein
MTVMASRVYGWPGAITLSGRPHRRSTHRGGAGATLPPVVERILRIRAATERTKYAPENEPDAPSGPPRPYRRQNMQGHPDDDALLTPSEVAAMFRVNPKTVTRWARAGKISAIRTLGGHRRFRASEIRQFLEKVEEHQDL